MPGEEKYSITKKNVQAHELIGLDVEVARSDDKGKSGIKGRVVDETRNMLYVESAGKTRKMPKKECVFRFRVDDGKVEVDGGSIVGRPEDRIKLFWRKCHGKMQ